MANSDQIDNIFMEAETLKALNHPNIVKMINFFVIKKTLQTFFIMEYLDGNHYTMVSFTGYSISNSVTEQL